MFLLILIIPRPNSTFDCPLVIWDIQTGVVIMKVNTPNSGKTVFHGNQRTITLVAGGGDIYTYNMFDGVLPQVDNVPLSLGSWSHTHWAHEGTLYFAVNLETDGKHMICIKELQATLTSPLHTLSSFPIPPQDGEFSFSPVSFHASFVTKNEVIVLDVQDSKPLLQAQVTQEDIKPGQFSPNGCFFACGLSEDKICIWQNTPTAYLPWRTLRPRLPFTELLFSPTAVSISCHGFRGIQLLQLGNHPGPLPPIEADPHCKYQKHLVAYSADWVHIAMARHGRNIVTVLNCCSGNPQQLIDPDMEVQDIRIVENTLFVVDRCKLVCWELEAGGTEGSAQSARRIAVETLVIDPSAEHLTLSHNCSQIAFTMGGTVFLHNLRAPGPITKYVSAHKVSELQFSPDQCKLQLLTESIDEAGGSKSYPINYHLVELAMMEGGGFGAVVVKPTKAREWKHLSSYGCCINSLWSDWVEDPTGRKLLWLPPNWRPIMQRNVKWNGNFLALTHGYHPEPVIIQFHP